MLEVASKRRNNASSYHPMHLTSIKIITLPATSPSAPKDSACRRPQNETVEFKVISVPGPRRPITTTTTAWTPVAPRSGRVTTSAGPAAAAAPKPCWAPAAAGQSQPRPPMLLISTRPLFAGQKAEVVSTQVVGPPLARGSAEKDVEDVAQGTWSRVHDCMWSGRCERASNHSSWPSPERVSGETLCLGDSVSQLEEVPWRTTSLEDIFDGTLLVSKDDEDLIGGKSCFDDVLLDSPLNEVVTQTKVGGSEPEKKRQKQVEKAVKIVHMIPAKGAEEKKEVKTAFRGLSPHRPNIFLANDFRVPQISGRGSASSFLGIRSPKQTQVRLSTTSLSNQLQRRRPLPLKIDRNFKGMQDSGLKRRDSDRHSNMERERRIDLRNCYDRLWNELLPVLPEVYPILKNGPEKLDYSPVRPGPNGQRRASKMEILTEAKKCCLWLQGQESKLTSETRKATEIRRKLNQKLERLRSQLI